MGQIEVEFNPPLKLRIIDKNLNKTIEPEQIQSIEFRGDVPKHMRVYYIDDSGYTVYTDNFLILDIHSKKKIKRKLIERSYMKQAMINYIKQGPNDELYTPRYAVLPLIKYIPKDKIIWECTDFGESEITKTFNEFGYNVVASYKDNLDFLNDKPKFQFDIIVTNPPYSKKNEFLERAYELGKPFAFLLPLTTLEGRFRGRLFREYGVEVLILDKRINFLKQKKNIWFNTSWFCWKLLPKQLIFEEVEVR